MPGANTMMDLVFTLLPYGIAFAAGYAIRELISRRRRTVERKKFLRRQEEEKARHGRV